MRFRAIVNSPDGKPLVKGEADLVVPDAGGPSSIGHGEIADGKLELSADPGAVWGLIVDKQPVLTAAKAVKGETVDLGEVNLLAAGIEVPAFHAPDGRVFALPGPVPASTRSGADAGSATVPVAIHEGLTFGGLLASAANQLSVAVEPASALQLSGASVRLRGVPKVAGDAVSLDFPNAELAAKGEGLSEFAFTLRQGPSATTPASTPTGTHVPDVRGYGSELATRKLAGIGLLSEPSHILVAEDGDEGRVVRQVPAPGTAVAAGSTVQLLIGKRGGS